MYGGDSQIQGACQFPLSNLGSYVRRIPATLVHMPPRPPSCPRWRETAAHRHRDVCAHDTSFASGRKELDVEEGHRVYNAMRLEAVQATISGGKHLSSCAVQERSENYIHLSNYQYRLLQRQKEDSTTPTHNGVGTWTNDSLKDA